jgi:hypothetical protein
VWAWRAIRCRRLSTSIVRRSLDGRTETARRQSIVSGDGSYTNKAVLRQLPPRTTFIGRIRKDARLHLRLPERAGATGRPRLYGPRAPTPERILQDDSIPAVKIRCFAAGAPREIPVKESMVQCIGAKPGRICLSCWPRASRSAIVSESAPNCCTASLLFSLHRCESGSAVIGTVLHPALGD